jgi:hypothetical protein
MAHQKHALGLFAKQRKNIQRWGYLLSTARTHKCYYNTKQTASA